MSTQLGYDQALALVRRYSEQSLGAFPAGVSLALLDENAVACSNSDDPSPETPVNIASSYWVHGIGMSGNGKYVDDFIAYWKTQGWRLARDDRPETQLAMMENSAGFDVIVQLTEDRSRVSISGSSPCVPPKPSPAPSSS